MRVRWIAWGPLLLIAALLSACSTPLSDDSPEESERVVTALFIDISGSTKTLRGSGGEFEQGAVETARQTAQAQGTLWAAVADENTVANSLWEIKDDAGDFVPPESVKGNETLVEGALTKQAEELEPDLVKLVEQKGGRGSDLLGALQMASDLFADYPDRPHALVMLTDGGINIPGFKLNSQPPPTPEEMDEAIKQLKDEGEIPDLAADGKPVRVWLAGLGHGFPRDGSQAVVEFWDRLIPAATGELVSSGTGSLRLVGFP